MRIRPQNAGCPSSLERSIRRTGQSDPTKKYHHWRYEQKKTHEREEENCIRKSILRQAAKIKTSLYSEGEGRRRRRRLYGSLEGDGGKRTSRGENSRQPRGELF